MATKIRLQRFGKKGKPVYHIVAADSRSKRDGRHIEKLGLYNPNTTPQQLILTTTELFTGFKLVLSQRIQLEQFYLTQV